jgi:hypothetical protein
MHIDSRTDNSVTKLNHAGAPVVGSPYAASLHAPYAIALDNNGQPWIANSGNRIRNVAGDRNRKQLEPSSRSLPRVISRQPAAAQTQ